MVTASPRATRDLPEDTDLLDLPADERPRILEADSQYPVTFDREDIVWTDAGMRYVRDEPGCVECGCELFMHPHHYQPRSWRVCSNCQTVQGRWWREPTLSSFGGGDG
jgi:hypothetical protein